MFRNTVKYRVEEMLPKLPFWKHRAPKMRPVEAQCAHRKHCYPEIPLGSHPTSRVSQTTQGGPGSVRLRFRDGTVQAVPVFGFGGSPAKRVFCISVQFNRKGRFRFRFRFLENGSGGSGGSAFGFGKNGSDGSGFRFRFGS